MSVGESNDVIGITERGEVVLEIHLERLTYKVIFDVERAREMAALILKKVEQAEAQTAILKERTRQ